MSDDELPFEESLVRPHVLHHTRSAPFAAPPVPVPKWERLDQRPRMVLIAWGADQAHVMRAIHRARERALDDELAIVNWFATYGRPMRKSPFTDQADRSARRHEIDYDFAWWLIPDWVIPPEQLTTAQAHQRATWSQEPNPTHYGPGALRPARAKPSTSGTSTTVGWSRVVGCDTSIGNSSPVPRDHDDPCRHHPFQLSSCECPADPEETS